MKRIILLLITSFYTLASFAQITANGNSTSQTTAYTNGTANDQIYIWCTDNFLDHQGSLTVTPSVTTNGPFTFNWYFLDDATTSWSFLSTSTGSTSVLNNLPSDGYRVEILDNSGVLIECYVAWVWNLSSETSISQSNTGCNQLNLTGVANASTSFTYYNPPSPESLITAQTQITVCFSATHTWVSDLAFYLRGPASCGSPTILLSPNPGAIGQGTICNSGDNVNNLCFTTSPAANLNVCAGAPFTLSGTYSSYGPSNTPINWGSLIGCNAAQTDWAVQIYDCIAGDFGALTNASITFSNLETRCGSSPNITYNSGAMNSAINDGSCSSATASIFQVGQTSTPIILNANAVYNWTASNPSVTFTNPTTSLIQNITPIPDGVTTYYLETTVSFAGTSCSSSIDSLVIDVTPHIFDDTLICGNSLQVLGTVSFNGGTWSSTSTAVSFSNPTANNPSITVSTPGTHIIRYATCQDTVFTTIIKPTTPSIFSDTMICGLTYQVDANDMNVYGNNGTWSYFVGGVPITFSPSATALTPTMTFSSSGSYIISFTDAVCNNTVSSMILVSGEPVITAPSVACNLNTNGLYVSSANNGHWFAIEDKTNNLQDDSVFISSNTIMNPILSVPNPGIYTVYFVDDVCNDTTSTKIEFPPYVWTEINDEKVCIGVEHILTAWQSTEYTVDFLWNTGSTNPSITVTSPGMYTVTVSNQCHSHSDSAFIDFYLCDIETPNVISLSSQAGNNQWYVNGDGIEKFNCVIPLLSFPSHFAFTDGVISFTNIQM